MVDENAVPSACHEEGDALVGDIARRPSILVPGLYALPVLDETGKPLSKPIDALSRLQRKLIDDVRLLPGLIQIILSRQHRGRSAVPFHITQIAETASGDNLVVFLEAVAEFLLIHPYTQAARFHDVGIPVIGNFCLLRVFKDGKSGLVRVVSFMVNDFHTDRIRPDSTECNRQAGDVHRIAFFRYLPKRHQQTHPVFQLLHLPNLRRIMLLHFLASEPVSFRKPHSFPPFQNP